MDLIKAFKQSDIVQLSIPSILDITYIKQFAENYGQMLKEFDHEERTTFFTGKVLKLNFAQTAEEISYEEFDLLFLSYLTLFKHDFNKVHVELHFPKLKKYSASKDFYSRLIQHRFHLSLNFQGDIFKVFEQEKETQIEIRPRSATYMPLLFINEDSIGTLFSKRGFGDDLRDLLVTILQERPRLTIVDVDFKWVQMKFIETVGQSGWNNLRLSDLYLLKTLDELYILKQTLFRLADTNHDYQIGKSIISSQHDRKSSGYFRDEIMKLIIEERVFSFSPVETYFFSLLVQQGNLFKIPESLVEMREIVNGLANVSLTISDTLVKQLYIDYYAENLKRVIKHTRDISFGLHELSKNIVEHSSEKVGIISARTYSFKDIKNLKGINSDWLDNFGDDYRFLDINVTDSGHMGIKSSYSAKLREEMKAFSNEINLADTRKVFMSAYNDDIKMLESFKLNAFFNFNSIRLHHQINRSKARFGLLIFSETILNDKKGLVYISSTDLSGTPEGYWIYNDRGQSREYPSSNPISIGTHYNFTVPIKDTLETIPIIRTQRSREQSSSSSVFLELATYQFDDSTGIKINEVDFVAPPVSLGKYEKLEFLKDQMGPVNQSQIDLIDAGTLSAILENSSDWIRFLANLQFTVNHKRDLIVKGLPLETYLEMINILSIFHHEENSEMGFWKNDRYILFYLPLTSGENTFWFNNLLFSSSYHEYLFLNEEIDTYHLNLSRIIKNEGLAQYFDHSKIDSLLFSSSKKLLNFELLIKNENGGSLFQETTKALLSINLID